MKNITSPGLIKLKGILFLLIGLFASLLLFLEQPTLKVAVLLAIFGSKIAEEAQTLAQQLPGLSDKLSNGQLVHVLGERRGWSYETEQRIQDFLTSHRGQIVGAVSAFSTRALSTVQRGWWLFLVPILAIFFVFTVLFFLVIIFIAALLPSS